MENGGAGGNYAAAATLDPSTFVVLRRLTIAVVASALTHSLLLYAVRVRAPEAMPSAPAPLIARIVVDVPNTPVAPAVGPPEEPAVSAVSPAPDRAVRQRKTQPPPRSPSAPAHRSNPPLRAEAPPVHGRQEAPPVPEAALPLAPDPNWYPAKQLDVFPRALAPIEPQYPERTVSSGTSGKVVVLLLIDEEGVVIEASVVKSEPQGYFQDSALAAVQAARFSPGRKSGRSVKSKVLMEVSYARRAATAPE